MVKSSLEDFIHLFYPLSCNACGAGLRRGERVVCTTCRFMLPRTGHSPGTGNALELSLRSHFRFEAACAYYHFTKGGRVQRLVHALKYRNQKEVGAFAGRKIAEMWKPEIAYMPDIIVPVPLHPERERLRGYNQAGLLAEAIAEALDIPLCTGVLLRKSAASSQTSKHRYERFGSLDGRFMINDTGILSGKTVMLVDDVITTGATILACAEALHHSSGIRLLITAMAATRR